MPEEKQELSSSPNSPLKPDTTFLSNAGKDEYPKSTDSDSSIIPAFFSKTLSQLNPPSTNIISFPISSELSPSEQLSEAKAIVQLRELKRAERIKAFDEWIGFITIKYD